MGATKACTRCRRVFALASFRRSLTGYPSNLCGECFVVPKTHNGNRPPLGAAPPARAPVIGSTDGLQPRERARHEARVLAATLVHQMLD